MLTTWRWTRSPWCGLFSAGLFAFSPIVWSYAITTEVFALNNLIVAAVLSVSLQHWQILQSPEKQGRALRLLFVISFFLRVGLSNHHTSVFFTAPLLGFSLWNERKLFLDRKGIVVGLKLAAYFFAGLLPYLYLPLAGSRHLLISWGDTATLEGFITDLLRKDYGTFRLNPHGITGQFLPGLKLYFLTSSEELLYMGCRTRLLGGSSSV